MAKQNADDQSEKDMIDALREVRLAAPVDEPESAGEERHGFLPFDTNAFDRGFIGVMLLVAIHLLWMRYLEASLPLELATAISLVLAVLIYRKG